MPNIAVVDIETTGSDRSRHEIVDIAIVFADMPGLLPWHTRVRPEHPELANERALEVNGYNPHDWAQAPCWCEVAYATALLLRNRLFVGHNARSFDAPFLRAQLARFRLEDGVALDVQDTYLMAKRLLKGKLDHFKLSDVCRFFGVPVESDTHGALGGTQCAAAIYRHLLCYSGQEPAW